MSREKRKYSIWYRLESVALISVLCLLLGVSVVWARYQLGFYADIFYMAKETPEVFLWSGATSAGFEEEPAEWSLETGTPTLAFYVSNGEDTACYAEEDMAITIRLIVSLGFGITEGEDGTVVVLSVTEEGKMPEEYIGTARRIAEDSPVYVTYGDGWIITFLDEEGQERKWSLSGGNLSILQGELTVEKSDSASTSMLTLQVNGELVW